MVLLANPPVLSKKTSLLLALGAAGGELLPDQTPPRQPRHSAKPEIS